MHCCKYLSTGLRWLWISVLVIALDRASKVIIQKYLALYDSVQVTPFFNFTLSFNRGSAFSFLDTESGWQVWMFGSIAALVSVTILIWLKKLPASQRWVGVALAFVLGGALGNLWDRLNYGHVVDFIDIHVLHYHWPVFNIADSAICVGAFMLLWDAIFFKKG